MASKKKDFTVKRYDEIKAAIKAAKIESYELENYIMMKDLKFLRHTEKISLNDNEIIELVNSTNKTSKYNELLKNIKKEEIV